MTADLEGRRALVVEDETLVAMMLEDMLGDLGCEVTTASRLDEALRLAASPGFDFAVLDINLDGERSYPAAEALRARGVPIVFSSGYEDAVLEDGFRGAPTVQKPYAEAALIEAILSAIGARPSSPR